MKLHYHQFGLLRAVTVAQGKDVSEEVRVPGQRQKLEVKCLFGVRARGIPTLGVLGGLYRFQKTKSGWGV